MKISFILYVFQVFGKNQYLTSHGIMYVFDDFLNFLNLTFIGIMYVFADFREKNFFTYFADFREKNFFTYSHTALHRVKVSLIKPHEFFSTYRRYFNLLSYIRRLNHLSISYINCDMPFVIRNADISRFRIRNNLSFC